MLQNFGTTAYFYILFICIVNHIVMSYADYVLVFFYFVSYIFIVLYSLSLTAIQKNRYTHVVYLGFMHLTKCIYRGESHSLMHVYLKATYRL